MPIGEEFFVSGLDPLRVEVLYPGPMADRLAELGGKKIEPLLGHLALQVEGSTFTAFEQRPGVALNITSDSRKIIS